MAKLWVGVDIGKAHHHVAALDGEGRLVFSRRVDNDERDILAVIAAVGRPVCWAVDVTTGLAALLLTPALATPDRGPLRLRHRRLPYGRGLRRGEDRRP